MPRRTEFTDTASTSERELQATADLIRTGGAEAVSTRAVASAAGVQPPAISRRFGDKEGLLDAAMLFIMQEHLAEMKRIVEAGGDCLHALRQMWDAHIQFGLTHPHTYVLTYGQIRPGKTGSATREAEAILRDSVARVAAEGRLRMSVTRATELVVAAGTGTVLTLIRRAENERDRRLSLVTRESVISAILSDKKETPAKDSGLAARAVALQEALRSTGTTLLSAAERTLLTDWLAKLADGL